MVRTWRSQIADEVRATSMMNPKSSIIPLENPETWKGSYDLHAYCKYKNPEHEWDEFPHVNMPCETGGDARNQLRTIGWIFHHDGTATCPKCAKSLKGRQHDK